MKAEESIVSQSPVPVPIKPIKHKKAPRAISASTVSLATTAPAQVYDGMVKCDNIIRDMISKIACLNLARFLCLSSE